MPASMPKASQDPVLRECIENIIRKAIECWDHDLSGPTPAEAADQIMAHVKEWQAVTESRTTVFMIEELMKIPALLSVGRKYGVVVTATPEAIQAIRQSGHRDAERIADNLCPVITDPWTKQA